jgi:acetyl/propionyl-CoA carboxylase alpha subunit
MTRITKLLIANRGEIASRITGRHVLDIKTVTVFSGAGRAAFVEDADEAVALPGRRQRDLLRGDLIIEAALRTGAMRSTPAGGFVGNGDFARRAPTRGSSLSGHRQRRSGRWA